MQRINEQVQDAVSVVIPAPVGGWNARDPFERMPELDAVSLLNMIPNTNGVELRKGFIEHVETLGAPVETIASLKTAAGANKLIAAADEDVYDVTTSGSPGSSLATGFANVRFYVTGFRNRLFLANGADAVQVYDGSTCASAAFTGPSNALKGGTHYRSRLYFIETTTGNIYYGAVDAVTGALTSFPVISQLERGGLPIAIGTWSTGLGDAVTQYFVIITDQGEGLIYGGSYPAGSDWELAARFFIPPPLGERCLVYMGKELHVVTVGGIYPLGPSLFGLREVGTREVLTDKIRNAFSSSAALTRAMFGWQAVDFPDGRLLIVNVPISELGNYCQYVMNTDTGAWCKFMGTNGACWTTHNRKLYFGGVDGAIYEANNGYSDGGNPITWEVKHAFNYNGEPRRNKLFNLVKPEILTTSRSLEIYADVNVDFEDRNISDTITTIGTVGTPWGSPWGSPWGAGKVRFENWEAVSGLGRSVSLVYRGSCSGVQVQLTHSLLNFVPGGVV